MYKKNYISDQNKSSIIVQDNNLTKETVPTLTYTCKIIIIEMSTYNAFSIGLKI